MTCDLTILIPARNEMFLARTIEDILQNMEGNTEIVAVLDGQWADPAIPQHEKVSVIYHPESVGQRAATNDAVKICNSKYVMKVDAHCAFDKGFDVKMMADMQDDWTMVPALKNLHAFDWVCKKCGNRWFQGPTPTHCCSDYDNRTKNDKCDSTEFEREIFWVPNKKRPTNYFFRYDKTLHFQYWKEYEKRPEAQGDLAETMSIQGSCFMLTRDKYLELDICDEAHGSWGQQGVEVANKTWLSGGKVMVNKKTWYAHLFRTQGGDFGFPYVNDKILEARNYSQDLWFNDKWPKAKHKLQWLIDKFNPPGWEEVSKGAIYYTDNQLDPEIMKECQTQLKQSLKQKKLVSSSLQPMAFGDFRIHLPLERGYLTMFKQILAALEAIDTEVVFFCEHDVLYHESHFDFTPPLKDKFYYNTNVWKVDAITGHAVKVDDCRQTSGLCAYRDLLLEHYKKRVELVEKNGFSIKMGFEPGTHNRPERVDNYKSDTWQSAYPNVDIRHNKNLTPSRWKKEQFRNQKYTVGWTEADEIPGWGKLKGFKL